MKRFTLLLIVCSLIAFPFKGQDCIITGTLSGFPDGTPISLTEWNDDFGLEIAVDTLKNGKFKMVVPVDSGMTRASISINSSRILNLERFIVLRPGARINISCDDMLLPTSYVKSNVAEQADLDIFTYNTKDLSDCNTRFLVDLNNALESASTREMRDSIMCIYNSRENFVDSLSIAMWLCDCDLMKKIPVTQEWKNRLKIMSKFVNSKRDHNVLLKEKLRNLYSMHAEELNKSSYGKIVYNLLYSEHKVNVGDKFPDTAFNDFEGKEHFLDEFKGKWVLFQFWHAGCGACFQAVPLMRNFAKGHSDEVATVFLSIDSGKAWEMGTQIYQIPFNNWSDNLGEGGLALSLGIKAYPTFVLVSPDGYIRDIWSAFNQNSFENIFKLYFDKRPKQSFTAEDGTRIISNPDFFINHTQGDYNIERIEVSEKGTKLCFSLNHNSNVNFKITPEAFIVTERGEKYGVVESDGIILGENYKNNENGNGTFSVTFKSIPSETEFIDFMADPEWRYGGVIREIKLQ